MTARASRRNFALGLAALGAAAAGFAAYRYWPEQGWLNPCGASLPRTLAGHEIVRDAWSDIDPSRVWDAHSHLLGIGDSGSGIVLNPAMESLLNPVQFAQRLFFLNAGCAHQAPGRVDRSYVERMRNLIDALRPGCKLVLFAFEANVDARGAEDWPRSGFYVPNAYAARIARSDPGYFEWAASIHPYRRDCVERLAEAVSEGARAVKWLPSAMGIDPASPLCDRFYAALARVDVPLISHAGLERAVQGADSQDLGNPLRLRRALEHGVRVVVAHCASMGEDRDLDRGEYGPFVSSFELFSRMMDESSRIGGRLYGDISAMTQQNRAGPALARVIERQDWHDRLLNGSDYPLPGVMPLYSVDYMVEQGFVPASVAPVLKGIRGYNPLLFDFVLKRQLRWRGIALGKQVFETRSFFERAGPRA